jgi:hypothetical protein
MGVDHVRNITTHKYPTTISKIFASLSESTNSGQYILATKPSIKMPGICVQKNAIAPDFRGGMPSDMSTSRCIIPESKKVVARWRYIVAGCFPVSFKTSKSRKFVSEVSLWVFS